MRDMHALSRTVLQVLVRLQSGDFDEEDYNVFYGATSLEVLTLIMKCLSMDLFEPARFGLGHLAPEHVCCFDPGQFDKLESHAQLEDFLKGRSEEGRVETLRRIANHSNGSRLRFEGADMLKTAGISLYAVEPWHPVAVKKILGANGNRVQNLENLVEMLSARVRELEKRP